jgi:uncharacterized protein DUF4154
MRRGEKEAREGEGRRVAPERRRRWRNRMRAGCGVLAAGVVLLTASVCGQPSAANANVAPEYEVKAAFLFRFAQFVEWPPETFKGAAEPFTYCTIGDDSFHGALERTLNGKTIGQRPLRVEHLNGLGKVGECQVLFIGGSGDRKHVEEMLADTGKLPILTVGEADRFAENGGAIGFCTEDNKIRFEVNLDAAGKAGLKISAKLLALAKTVLGAPKGT